jgi:hypothetical protein
MKAFVCAIIFASMMFGEQAGSAEETQSPPNIPQIAALKAVKVALVGNNTDLSDDSNALRVTTQMPFVQFGVASLKKRGTSDNS